MAKTIQIIFVKENNLGKLLEGAELHKYLELHNQAVMAYKQSHSLIEAIKGPRVNVHIEAATTDSLTKDNLQSAVNRVLIYKDDGAIILLQDVAFTNYWTIHQTGLKALNKTHKDIKGQYVWTTITK